MKTLTNGKIAVSALSVQAAVHFLASLAPCRAEPAPAIHYAPTENLEHIDVALIDRAEREIDMAAYVLTDWPVMQALTRAADRGVAIRIYLDGTQHAEREPAKVFNDLAETPGVEIRTKHENSAPMHLKSYEIDGRLLRTGAANFYNRGLAYDHKKLYDQAIADHAKAIELKPDYAGAYMNRGNAYHDKKLYDQAIADYTKAIEFKPDYAQAYTNRGLENEKLGQRDKAIADYRQALSLAPDTKLAQEGLTRLGAN